MNPFSRIGNWFTSKAPTARKSSHRFRPMLQVLEDRLAPALLTVTTTLDNVVPGDGVVTLREAIQSINAGSDLGDPDIFAQKPGSYGTSDTIHFSIPGDGVHTITLLDDLDTITKPMAIDGYTQPGSSVNSLADGNNAVILITLDANHFKGLTIARDAEACTIRGLSIIHDVDDGINLHSSGNVIVGNFIGLHPDGVTPGPNGGAGVMLGYPDILDDSWDLRNLRIGGNSPADRNVISSNLGDGVRIFGRIHVEDEDETRFDQQFNQIQGNYIGTDASGTLPRGNAGDGISLTGARNLIGGTTSNEANTIAFNLFNGVSGGLGDKNAIRRNAIFSNGGLGIDQPELRDGLFHFGVTGNDSGDNDVFNQHGNRYQNFPILVSATSSTDGIKISGVINSNANSALILDFFANKVVDPSGYGEGEIYLGSTGVVLDAGGNATFTATFMTSVPAGYFIAATATSIGDFPYGDTSEFSHAIPLVAPVVNQPPEIDDQSFNVNENWPAGLTVGTVVASDPDAGQSLTFAILSGNTGGAFWIDPGTGVIRVNNDFALDFETTPVFHVTVQVSDDGSPSQSSTATVTINLNDVNEAPVIADQAFSVTENSAFGTLVGTATAIDQDAGQMLTYAILSGNTGSAFAINPGTGQITVNNSATLDYETTPTFSLLVQVSDNGVPSKSSTATITIKLLNANDAPMISAPSFPQSLTKNKSFTFSQAKGNAITIADPDSSTALLQVTLTVQYGTLTLASKTGLTFLAGDGTSDKTITFQGTAAAINAALDGLVYKPRSGFLGTDSLAITVDDLGSGLGDPLSTTAILELVVQQDKK